jgi:hypothetical protein
MLIKDESNTNNMELSEQNSIKFEEGRPPRVIIHSGYYRRDVTKDTVSRVMRNEKCDFLFRPSSRVGCTTFSMLTRDHIMNIPLENDRLSQYYERYAQVYQQIDCDQKFLQDLQRAIWVCMGQKSIETEVIFTSLDHWICDLQKSEDKKNEQSLSAHFRAFNLQNS